VLKQFELFVCLRHIFDRARAETLRSISTNHKLHSEHLE